MKTSQLLNLVIDHALSGLLLILEALVLTLLLHVFKALTLFGEGLNFLLLFNLLEALGFLHPHELRVGFGQVGAHLGDLLLAHDFALLFALQVFLNLPLDEFALEHLFFQLLDEVQFEVLELLADVFCVRLLQLVLLLELGAHLLVVLVHLLALHLFPVLVDVAIDLLLAAHHDLLRLLLVRHVAHQHLALQSLDHVLLLSHRLVRSLNLLPS
mmetsp:Transcript_26481/g.35410  ORF Transcript_26481/g.35410 Transcript_26481/m.35410 type:complete len:213 (+) Transcript_26481:623-1261(+)